MVSGTRALSVSLRGILDPRADADQMTNRERSTVSVRDLTQDGPG